MHDGTPREIIETFVCDVDGDGDYMDVTADDELTHADVTEFFRNQHRPVWSSDTEIFDFDEDGTVGQSDVIALFEAL